MKDLDHNLSKALLSSVTSVLQDSSKVKAEEAKKTNEQMKARYGMMPKPTSLEDAKVDSYAAKAPERRLNDAIASVYTKSVAEHAAQAKQESDAIKNAYAARGGVKPVVEELTPKQKKHIDKNKNNKIDAHDFEILRTRKAKMATDVSDETILDGNTIAEKEGYGGSDPLANRAAYAKKHGTGQVYKKTRPGDKVGMTKAFAYDIKRAGPKVGSALPEEKDTPGNSYDHQCAIHVKHATLGEGRTLFSQHAEPDAEGQIAWYDVMFAEGIEKKVPTTDLEILVSESHMKHKKKKM